MTSKRYKTNYPGVRFKEHRTRKHGIKLDRYFSIYYWLNGTKKEEGLGWGSQGWSAQKAAKALFDLKESQRLGAGPQTLRERREIVHEKRTQADRDSLIFSDAFKKHYLPEQEFKKSYKSEEILYRVWIEPVIGNIPLIDISSFHLERIIKNLRDKGRSASSIRYVLAVISQTFNYLKRNELYKGDNPATKIKKPRADNKRVRFLTIKEATILLEELQKRSKDLHDIAAISLYCGLRASEVFNLTWGDADLVKGFLFIKDTKSGHNRYAYLTDKLKQILQSREHGANDVLIFRDRNGKKIKDVSRTFERAVEDLKFNTGVKDHRQKLVFHSLRHTYASWLVQSGVDLYRVQKLLGHSSARMTERYAHIGENNLKDAVFTFEKSLIEPEKSKVNQAGANR